MLIKLETKSARVKGITFHPKRPWVLSSLHDGSIQLWDYRMHILLDKFEEHIGPVRGINFHLQQPLFVSGGDDYKVKVWNYKVKCSMFTLLGHMDYVRSVHFHHEYAWILSASDDQTIKLWNWQNRSCILTITGHNHYVMCAMFHPTLDLIASASLDASIRIWDISLLVSKQLKEDKKSDTSVELFGHSYAVVKHILESHQRGVNWVNFHPNLPLVVSAADDKLVKIWRLNDSKAWEVQSFRGHYGNVSSAVFDSTHDYVVSNSEDKSIRVWDLTKQICIYTFRREHDRFWCMTIHPRINSIAAGHDTGLIVFKLERERPVYTIVGDNLFYIKDVFLRKLEFSTSKDVQKLKIKGNDRNLRRTLSFNTFDNTILISTKYCTINEMSFYELHKIAESNSEEIVKKNLGMVALWITRNKYVVLDHSCHLILKNFNNEVKKKLMHPMCDEIFQAGTGFLLLKNQEQIYLYDVQQMTVVNKAKINNCRYVVWSSDMSKVALLSKNNINLYDKKLNLLCTINERSRIKSGAWDASTVFIYTTTNQIKYLLTNGDNGTIRTLDVPIYITKVNNDKVFCLDRKCQTLVFNNNSTEYRFKLALISKQQEQILYMIKNTKLVGQSIVFYLKQKGHSDIALHFIQNQKVRFDLAIECGNIQIAFDAAKKLNENIAWAKLSDIALWQGNINILEYCYQQMKCFHKLSFIYLITGNLKKLNTMLKIAEKRNDVSAQYQNALLLGDIKERVNILKTNKLPYYAFISAATHGLYSEAQVLRNIHKYGTNDLIKNAKFLVPPPPVQELNSNWPILRMSETFLHDDFNIHSKFSMQTEGDNNEKNNWIEDDNQKKNERDGWEIDVPSPVIKYEQNKNNGVFLPTKRECLNESKLISPKTARNLILLGDFDEAFKILNKQFGIINFDHFRDIFIIIFTSTRCVYTCLCNIFPQYHITATASGNKNKKYNNYFEKLVSKLQDGYNLTTAGNFQHAVIIFRNILLEIAVIPIGSRKEITDIANLIKICRSYICGLQMETHRKNLSQKNPNEMIKQCEMIAYLTHCNLQQPHQILALRSAVTLFYKVNNFKTAASFGKRLLQLCPKQEIVTQTQKIIKYCERNLCDNVIINYNEHNPFDICAYSYQAIYKGYSCVKCPFCQSLYLVKYKGCICNVCKVAEIGLVATGLRHQF